MNVEYDIPQTPETDSLIETVTLTAEDVESMITDNAAFAALNAKTIRGGIYNPGLYSPMDLVKVRCSDNPDDPNAVQWRVADGHNRLKALHTFMQKPEGCGYVVQARDITRVLLNDSSRSELTPFEYLEHAFDPTRKEVLDARIAGHVLTEWQSGSDYSALAVIGLLGLSKLRNRSVDEVSSYLHNPSQDTNPESSISCLLRNETPDQRTDFIKSCLALLRTIHKPPELLSESVSFRAFQIVCEDITSSFSQRQIAGLLAYPQTVDKFASFSDEERGSRKQELLSSMTSRLASMNLSRRDEETNIFSLLLYSEEQELKVLRAMLVDPAVSYEDLVASFQNTDVSLQEQYEKFHNKILVEQFAREYAHHVNGDVSMEAPQLLRNFVKSGMKRFSPRDMDSLNDALSLASQIDQLSEDDSRKAELMDFRKKLLNAKHISAVRRLLTVYRKGLSLSAESKRDSLTSPLGFWTDEETQGCIVVSDLSSPPLFIPQREDFTSFEPDEQDILERIRFFQGTIATVSDGFIPGDLATLLSGVRDSLAHLFWAKRTAEQEIARKNTVIQNLWGTIRRLRERLDEQEQREHTFPEPEPEPEIIFSAESESNTPQESNTWKTIRVRKDEGSQGWFSSFKINLETATVLIDETAQTVFPDEITANWPQIRNTLQIPGGKSLLIGRDGINKLLTPKIAELVRARRIDTNTPEFAFLGASIYTRATNSEEMRQALNSYRKKLPFRYPDLLELIMYDDQRSATRMTLLELLRKNQYEQAQKLCDNNLRPYGGDMQRFFEVKVLHHH